MNKLVTQYIDDLTLWQKEAKALRKIILKTGLEECFKWGKPCYSFNESNIVLIQCFKNYFALLFFKGALLKDPKKELIKMGENTRVGRQLRFSTYAEVKAKEAVIKFFIQAAIQVEKKGLKVTRPKASKINFPAELLEVFAKNPKLQSAFEKLTPGRQHGYCFFISQAKQAKTRFDRIEKCSARILAGKGLRD